MHLEALHHQELGQKLKDLALGLAAAGALAWYVFRRRRPAAGERERIRREHLARNGRITDGALIDNPSPAPAPVPPTILFYRYRVAGVTYESAQDISQLSGQVRGLRVERPVQVRYDARNPSDSILVSESWNGLQSSPLHQGEPPPSPPQPRSQPIPAQAID